MSKLSVGLIQTRLHWESPAKNHQHFDSLITGLPPVDLIVLPEMFSTGFSMASQTHAETMRGPTVGWLKSTAKTLDTPVCGSVMIKAGDQYFNRFMLVHPGAEPICYDKRHLFRMADEHHHYQPGQARVIFEINGFRICPQVCYDLRFPVFSRNRGDYDLLLYVANWPAPRRLHWRTLLTARAIENQSYVIGLNRVGSDGNDVDYAGDSGLINANGDWLADLGNEDITSVVEVDRQMLDNYRAGFPAWQDADAFTLGEH